MFHSSYSTEQQIRTELAERRAQVAEARRARQAYQASRPASRRLAGRTRQLIQRLALLLSSTGA